MDISKAIDIRTAMRASGVIMAYNGVVSDELMVTLADILKSRMEGLDDAKRSRTVFSVFMEGMQNLIWHGRTNQNAGGMVCISQQDAEITIVCGNRIRREDSVKLNETLDQLQHADKDTICSIIHDSTGRGALNREERHEGQRHERHPQAGDLSADDARHIKEQDHASHDRCQVAPKPARGHAPGDERHSEEHEEVYEVEPEPQHVRASDFVLVAGDGKRPLPRRENVVAKQHRRRGREREARHRQHRDLAQGWYGPACSRRQDDRHQGARGQHRNSAERSEHRGASQRAFCAGLDLVEGAVSPRGAGKGRTQAGLHTQQMIAALVPRLRGMRKPVIAAVNGAASGGGLALAVACDIRIGGRSSRFNVAFVKIGLSGCDIGVSWLLPRIVGTGPAFHMMLTGRMVEAEEAERMGLITRLVADDALLDAALAEAELIVGNSPFGVWMTKEVMWSQLEVGSLQAGIDLENRTQILASTTGDMEEAVSAFLERRAPQWGDR